MANSNSYAFNTKNTVEDEMQGNSANVNLIKFGP
jgi:hypothetical protein